MRAIQLPSEFFLKYKNIVHAFSTILLLVAYGALGYLGYTTKGMVFSIVFLAFGAITDYYFVYHSETFPQYFKRIAWLIAGLVLLAFFIFVPETTSYFWIVFILKGFFFFLGPIFIFQDLF